MSFITPIFLAALATALLPVLYHLVRKVKAKRVPFSSLMFLKATPREIVRRRRIKDWLLMAARALIFALIALAFARPFVPRDALPFVSQRQDRSVVLLVDRSYSMQHEGAFEAARAEALQRLNAAAGEDEFAVIAFDDEVSQLTPLGTDLALHRSVLESALRVGNRPTDFFKPLQMAEELLENARHEVREIVLISDLQMNGWGGAFENWKIRRDIEFTPVRVGTEATGNAYIEAFHHTTRRAGTRVVNGFDALVAAQGTLAEAERELQLLVDGEPVDEVMLPPLPLRRASFQRQAEREGFFQGTLTLEDDGLPVDNHYYLTYTVTGRPSLLGIDGGPAGRQRDAFFLRSAFDLGEDALYSFTDGTFDQLTRAGLRDHQVVFLSNVPALDAGQIEALRAYVEEGGHVIISFGDQVDFDRFGAVIEGLGVGQLAGPVSPRRVQRYDAIIGEVDLRHPVFSVFAGAGSGAIFRPTFREYALIHPDSSTVVPARYDTDDPFLLERRLGAGGVLVLTTTFNTGWTDFPLNEMYVPFVYQLVRYALEAETTRHEFTVGETVRLTGRPGDEWEVQAPGDRLLRVAVDDTGVGFFRDTEAPGHYAAARGTDRFYFSVNVDPRESDLRTRDAEEVHAAVVPPPDDVALTVEQAAAVAVEDEEKKQKLWRYLILAVLALFAFETYFANRKARRPVAG